MHWNHSTFGASAKNASRYSENRVRPVETIESNIQGAEIRVRHEMNGALIAIGTGTDHVMRAARAAARRIGPVDVHQGQSSCKTPEALPYLERARAHRKKKQAAKRK